MNCSWCYGEGHNKLGCPKLKKAAAPWIPKWEKHKKEMNAKGRAAREYLFSSKNNLRLEERLGLQNHIKKQGRSKTAKACNFCGEQGHNKRTCDPLKKVKADMIKANAGFRIAMAESIKKSGQGIGALVSGECRIWDKNGYGWHKKSGIGIITNISWEHISLIDLTSTILSMGGWSPVPVMRVEWSFGATSWIDAVGGLEDPTNPNKRFLGGPESDLSLVSRSESINPPKDWFASRDDYFITNLNKYFRKPKALDAGSFAVNTGFRKTMDRWIEYGDKHGSR